MNNTVPTHPLVPDCYLPLLIRTGWAISQLSVPRGFPVVHPKHTVGHACAATPTAKIILARALHASRAPACRSAPSLSPRPRRSISSEDAHTARQTLDKGEPCHRVQNRPLRTARFSRALVERCGLVGAAGQTPMPSLILQFHGVHGITGKLKDAVRRDLAYMPSAVVISVRR